MLLRSSIVVFLLSFITKAYFQKIKTKTKKFYFRFDVVSKQPVEIILSNDDEMPHNLVVSKPGSLRRIGRASDAQGLEGEAAARDYVPDISGILHASELVLPGQTRVLRFIAPERPGRYPYICTYPAHWQMMNGVLKVVRP